MILFKQECYSRFICAPTDFVIQVIQRQTLGKTDEKGEPLDFMLQEHALFQDECPMMKATSTVQHDINILILECGIIDSLL